MIAILLILFSLSYFLSIALNIYLILSISEHKENKKTSLLFMREWLKIRNERIIYYKNLYKIYKKYFNNKNKNGSSK